MERSNQACESKRSQNVKNDVSTVQHRMFWWTSSKTKYEGKVWCSLCGTKNLQFGKIENTKRCYDDRELRVATNNSCVAEHISCYKVENIATGGDQMKEIGKVDNMWKFQQLRDGWC